jgi:C-methyltransferase
VLIADAVLAESGADSTLASFDMQMLIGTAGRERTLSEWQQLLAGSGFTLVNVLDVRTFAKFLVLRRE